jgi:hypothetical protein
MLGYYKPIAPAIVTFHVGTVLQPALPAISYIKVHYIKFDQQQNRT